METKMEVIYNKNNWRVSCDYREYVVHYDGKYVKRVFVWDGMIIDGLLFRSNIIYRIDSYGIDYEKINNGRLVKLVELEPIPEKVGDMIHLPGGDSDLSECGWHLDGECVTDDVVSVDMLSAISDWGGVLRRKFATVLSLADGRKSVMLSGWGGSIFDRESVHTMCFGSGGIYLGGESYVVDKSSDSLVLNAFVGEDTGWIIDGHGIRHFDGVYYDTGIHEMIRVNGIL